MSWWSLCPFWPECGSRHAGGCADCDDEFDDEGEEAYWENLSEDEWEDYAEWDEKHGGGVEREGHIGLDGDAWVQAGQVAEKVVAKLAERRGPKPEGPARRAAVAKGTPENFS